MELIENVFDGRHSLKERTSRTQWQERIPNPARNLLYVRLTAPLRVLR
jgi:hypothetical protein